MDSRLREMRDETAPALLWDEKCQGSARALALFVGPSPGGPGPGDTKASDRHSRKENDQPALWNKSFDEPRLQWGGGFRTSFAPLVEAVFALPYAKAGKLVGVGNLDWMGDPNSADVQEAFMREGAPSVLRMIEACSPELVLPMDKKAFRILKEVMEKARFIIADCEVKEFRVRISDAAKVRLHSEIYCFRAASKERELVVVKLPQHPARMFQADYATRCGKAVRLAAQQIAAGQPIDVSFA